MTSIHALLLAAVLLAAQPARAVERVYPDVARADADVAAALQEAARTHRRVLVDFGGDWCTDCKVLDLNFRRPENATLLAQRYVVVHVNVGDRGIRENFALADRYGIPLRKGVPALAVLEADGRVVYSQRHGEFESMRSMDPRSVHAFLERWKGP